MRMLRQSVVWYSRILYSLFTQERSFALVYVAVPRGSAARMSTTEADMKRAADHRGPPSSRSYAHSCSGVEWSGKVDIVVRIRDVVAALDAVGAFRPRLMLMDIEMPSMRRHESRVDYYRVASSTRIVRMSADESPRNSSRRSGLWPKLDVYTAIPGKVSRGAWASVGRVARRN